LTAFTSITATANLTFLYFTLTHTTNLGAAFIRFKISHFFSSVNHKFPLRDYRIPTMPFLYSYLTPSATLGTYSDSLHLTNIPLVQGLFGSLQATLFRTDGREANSILSTFQVQVQPP
jgi:hypothetical protein